MHRPAVWLPLSLSILLYGCASRGEPPQTVTTLDLQRYQGQWYEIARLPLFFQRKCVASEARYGVLDESRVSVHNRCRTAGGDWQEARGEARLVPGEPAKLKVRFDNWFSRLFPRLTEGDYWVLYVDGDYQQALVGHPERKYLWLLSRQPQLSDAQREQLLGVAREQGYDNLDELIWREAP